MSSIANYALRGFELFCSVIVLALSANLVAKQRYGGAPSVTNYEVFVGILGFVAALIGLAGSMISALGGIIALAVDALTALFLFAGGIAFAALIPLHCSCNEKNQLCDNLAKNNVVNGGVDKNHNVALNYDRVQACRQAQADTAFIWFAWAAFCASAFFSFLAWRRGGLK